MGEFKKGDLVVCDRRCLSGMDKGKIYEVTSVSECGDFIRFFGESSGFDKRGFHLSKPVEPKECKGLEKVTGEGALCGKCMFEVNGYDCKRLSKLCARDNCYWKPKENHDRKYDTGKPMVGLMEEDFAMALLAVSEISRYGIEKYKKRGSWKEVQDGFNRYKDAQGRHRLLSNLEDYDDESGYLHAVHEAWNSLAKVQFMMESMGKSPRDVSKVTKPKLEGVNYENCGWYKAKEEF